MNRYNRRDVLKAMGAASAALLLPQAGNAAESSVGSDIEIQVVSVSAHTARLSVIPIKDKQTISIPTDGSLVKSSWGAPVLKVGGNVANGIARCGDLNVSCFVEPSDLHHHDCSRRSNPKDKSRGPWSSCV